MTNFRTLYGYELKKIVRRKMVWVSVLLMVLIVLVSVGIPLLGTYYADGKAVDTNYHMFQVDRAYQKALSGRWIDQTLLEEMKAGNHSMEDGGRMNRIFMQRGRRCWRKNGRTAF